MLPVLEVLCATVKELAGLAGRRLVSRGDEDEVKEEGRWGSERDGVVGVEAINGHLELEAREDEPKRAPAALAAEAALDATLTHCTPRRRSRSRGPRSPEMVRTSSLLFPSALRDLASRVFDGTVRVACTTPASMLLASSTAGSSSPSTLSVAVSLRRRVQSAAEACAASELAGVGAPSGRTAGGG
jgi:hypothetical protein